MGATKTQESTWLANHILVHITYDTIYFDDMVSLCDIVSR